MEELIPPNVGANFKKWMCYKPILSKVLAHFLNIPSKKKFNKFFSKKTKQSAQGQGLARGPQATAGRRPAQAPQLAVDN
jgi:hypothetical protein